MSNNQGISSLLNTSCAPTVPTRQGISEMLQTSPIVSLNPPQFPPGWNSCGGNNVIITSGSGGGGGGGDVTSVFGRTGSVVAQDADYSLSQIGQVAIASPAINQILIFNGSNWVNAAPNTNFTFAINSFTCNAGASGSVFEIGTGVWATASSLVFSATYNNGPPVAAYVVHTGWSNLSLTNDFNGPTNSVSSDSYPGVGGSLTYTLTATNGSTIPTSTITYNFYNFIYYGVSSINSGFTSSEILSLGTSYLSNSRISSFTVDPSSGQYIIWAAPARLGTASFTVGGFAGGFSAPTTVTVTNSSGYVEAYYVYASVNTNLGTTSVTTS